MRDKQKIQIDELFRERFRDESDWENFDSSWSKMEALLDREQNKRRAIIWRGLNWLVPALLLSLTGAGIGYWIYQTPGEELGNNQSLAIAETQQQNSKSELNAISQPNSSTNSKVEKEVNDDPSTTHQHTSINVADVTHTAGALLEKSTQTNPSPAKTKRQPRTTTGQNTTQHNTSQNTSVADNNSSIPDGIPVIINDKGKVEKAPKKANLLTQSNGTIHTLTPGDIHTAALEGNLVVDRKTGEVKKQNLKKVRGVVMREQVVKNDQTNTRSVVVDTVGYSVVEKLEYIPLSQEEIKALQKLALVQTPGNEKYDFIQLLDMNKENTELMVSADKNTIHLASKSGKDKERIASSILRDVNNYFEIKNPFVFTVFGGFNSSASRILPLGLQASLGAHYLIGTHWTIGAEFGYAFRPFTYSFTDQAAVYTLHGAGTPVSNGVRYDYREESTSKTYAINTLNTFNLPVLLSYDNGKFGVFGGPSLFWSSKIRYVLHSNYEASDKSIVLPESESFNMQNSSLKATSQDFEGRFGYGFMVGARYALTDRLGLTFRYSQVLSDNAKGEVGQIISKETFHLPSFRLGLTYRLNKDKKVKYMMGNDK